MSKEKARPSRPSGVIFQQGKHTSQDRRPLAPEAGLPRKGFAVIRITGYLLTLIALSGVFFPGLGSPRFSVFFQAAGHMAFGIFALLIARGARRTSNPFLYFFRLLTGAFLTALILLAADHLTDAYFPARNALFTYASGIALIAGLSMSVGCCCDMVARAVPADGNKTRKRVWFNVPVNPGHYRLPPATGMTVGFLSCGLTLFVTLYYRFSHGLYGLFFILLAFIAMRDADPPKQVYGTPAARFSRHLSRTLFSDTAGAKRSLIYLSALTLAFLLLQQLAGSSFTLFEPPAAFSLAALPLGMALPDFRKAPSGVHRWMRYAALPASCAVFLLIRILSLSEII